MVVQTHCSTLNTSTPITTSYFPPSLPTSTSTTAHTEEVVKQREQHLQLMRRYKDKADTRIAEMAQQEHNMKVDVQEAQTMDVEMIEVEHMKKNAQLEVLQRLKKLDHLEYE
jgi:hypothetical protein